MVVAVGCQNTTTQIQSLREERSSTGAQHSNLLFKYLAGASTQVSEHEPRHMGAPQHQLNCSRHMHEQYIYACTKRQTSRLKRLHRLGLNARISIAQERTSPGRRTP